MMNNPNRPSRPISPILYRPKRANSLSETILDLVERLANDSFCNSRLNSAIILQSVREKNTLTYTLYHLTMEILDKWEDKFLHTLAPITAPGAKVPHSALQSALLNTLEDIYFAYKNPDQANAVIATLFKIQRELDNSISAKVTGSLDVINELSHDYFLKILGQERPDMQAEYEMNIDPSRR